MRDNVQKLQAEIAKEKKAIRTLKAELAWLGSFERIDAGARSELGLHPIDGSKIKTLEEIDEIAPRPLADAGASQSENGEGGEIAKP